MKASLLIESRKHKIVGVPEPEINENEVLIQVKVCGVCASEIYDWENGEGQQRILGHEPVGIIREMGRNVLGFQVGDRVTGLFLNAFAEYTKADYRKLIKVPSKLDTFESIGEPLSCLISGANRTPVSFGDDVAIIGSGFMGLGLIQLMRLRGAGNIIVVDVREEGLQNARRLGANMTFYPKEVPSAYKVIEWSEIGQGVPIVAEVSGTQAGIELASEMTAAHGTLSIVGYHQSNNGFRNINMKLWNWKAITVVNAAERRYQKHLEGMKAVLRLIELGQFSMKDMITHVYSLDEVDKAYQDLKNKPNGFIKGVVRIS